MSTAWSGFWAVASGTGVAAGLTCVLAWCVLGGAVACRAGAHAHADSRSKAEVDAFAEFDEKSIEDEKGKVNEFAEPPTPGASGPTLLGARHDLFLKPSVTANCQCLAVAAGDADDPRFGWEAQVPVLNASQELALAFRSEECPAAGTETLGAAYRGYRTTDAGDVVVMVEAARDGRPKIAGAILPRPQGAGRILIEPFPAQLPYGQPLAAGAKGCQIAF